MADHVHVWRDCAPGTVGAGAASVCSCGLYSVVPIPAESDPAYYEVAGTRARTIRLLTQQGYTDVTDDPQATRRELPSPNTGSAAT